MANRRYESQFFYSFHAMPVNIDCAFNVTPTNADGITNLTGGGVKRVFMQTSTTPSAGNPNPANGYIWMQLQDNYKFIYQYSVTYQPPQSGSNIAVTAAGALLTVGVPYSISALGTTTTADWLTLGVPVGVTPAVGVTFIALATGAGTGTGQVQTKLISNISTTELLSASANTLSLANPSRNGGSILIFKCLGPTNSSTTTLIPTAPATTTRIRIQLLLSNSSVTIQGD